MNRGRGRSALSPNAGRLNGLCPARRFSRAEHAHAPPGAASHTGHPNRRSSGYAPPRAGPGPPEGAHARRRQKAPRSGAAVGRRAALRGTLDAGVAPPGTARPEPRPT